jgi:hypothetical protein
VQRGCEIGTIGWSLSVGHERDDGRAHYDVSMKRRISRPDSARATRLGAPSYCSEYRSAPRA